MADFTLVGSMDPKQITKAHDSALRDMQRKQMRVNNALRREAQSKHREMVKEWKESNDQSFGSKAMQQIATYAAGIVSVQAAVRGVTAAWQEQNRVRQEAAETVRSAEVSFGQLAQLAQGDPVQAKSLRAAALQTFREGGARTLAEAADITFSLGSAGALGERKFFSDLSSIVQDPGELAKSAVTIQETFGKQAGTLEDIISKALVASGGAPAKAGELLEATARSGASSAEQGFALEDVFALTMLTSKAAGGPERAATQVQRLVSSLRFKVPGGADVGGIFEGIELIKGLVGTEKPESLARRMAAPAEDIAPEYYTALELIGRETGVAAFDVAAKNLPRLADISREIASAPSRDVAQRSIDTAMLMPEVGVPRTTRAMENAEILSREALGAREVAIQGFEAREQERQRREGMSEFGIATGSLIRKGMSSFISGFFDPSVSAEYVYSEQARIQVGKAGTTVDLDNQINREEINNLNNLLSTSEENLEKIKQNTSMVRPDGASSSRDDGRPNERRTRNDE